MELKKKNEKNNWTCIIMSIENNQNYRMNPACPPALDYSPFDCSSKTAAERIFCEHSYLSFPQIKSSFALK